MRQLIHDANHDDEVMDIFNELEDAQEMPTHQTGVNQQTSQLNKTKQREVAFN